MVSAETSLEEIRQRLIKLEKYNRGLRNIAAAVLLLVVALFTMAQAGPGGKGTTRLDAASSSTPRYEIVFSPHVREDTFLLDTTTGQTWKQVKYTDVEGQPEIWHPWQRVDNDRHLLEWLSRQKSVPTESK